MSFENHQHATQDWAALSLPDFGNAFSNVPAKREPDNYTPPPKRVRPSPDERSRISMETPEEKKAKREAKILRVNKQDFTISPDPQGDADRTAKICGRKPAARCQ